MTLRKVFFLSDRTGITVELLGNSLLSQFEDFDFQRVRIPYLDSDLKLEEAIGRIETEAAQDEQLPLVFSTLVDAGARERLAQARCRLFDLFGSFITDLEHTLGRPSSQVIGRAHGIVDLDRYERRVDSMNYCLSHDDGARLTGLDRAEVILIGVSRSGKTPTCLYLSLHYGIYAANYPLTPEDLVQDSLPEPLRPFRNHLLGLSIQPERLCSIRQARRAESAYAAVETCRREVRLAEALFHREGIPVINSSSLSIEEIGSKILHRLRINGHIEDS